jgi:hypothetical protein
MRLAGLRRVPAGPDLGGVSPGHRAEAEGFEPPDPVKGLLFSRQVQSAALPRLLEGLRVAGLGGELVEVFEDAFEHGGEDLLLVVRE